MATNITPASGPARLFGIQTNLSGGFSRICGSVSL